MERLFTPFSLDGVELVNRFVFPPLKTAYGNPDGKVTDGQLNFYRQIARNGPGLIILEPVAVTPEGREHPKQLSVHLPDSAQELKKIVEVIHGEGRLACLHLNHAGAAANPKATGAKPKAPFPCSCTASGQKAEALTAGEIQDILAGYESAARKAKEAGVDVLEIQAGHGYLVSQFLNGKINKREDRFGQDRQLFVREVISAVRRSAGEMALILRISGDEMSPEYGLPREELPSLLDFASEAGISAIHVGMGSTCFSPPWYFHHMSLPGNPQMDAVSRIRQLSSLPIIAAGRLGRKDRTIQFVQEGLADLLALGRPIIADPQILEKWRKDQDERVIHCGYCLQGCLHRVRTGEGLGCNVNAEIGQPDLKPTSQPLKVLVTGGGPAGMSAARYLAKRGHQVTLVEKEQQLGGQFALAWKAPGKEPMRESLESLVRTVEESQVSILLGRRMDAGFVKESNPDLLVWATGAQDTIPEIPGLSDQRHLTALEFYRREKEVLGPRVLVIGAGRTGLEIAEELGQEGYEVVATKRTDPIGSHMEMVTRNLTLKRIAGLSNVTVLPHTAVNSFSAVGVEIDTDGEKRTLEPFQTVILAFGLLPAPGPDEEIQNSVSKVEIIGDAQEIQDIFTATQAGYQLALKY
jgi:2,4-dienoyl-CoA reductase-like NADH-dependent reductase (Old Yellow Enzyme family)/thioredoxin reductase